MPTVLRPELPPEIDVVFGRVLAKRPEERYGSCREFVEAARMAMGVLGPGTESALAYGATTAGPQTGPGVPSPGPRRACRAEGLPAHPPARGGLSPSPRDPAGQTSTLTA